MKNKTIDELLEMKKNIDTELRKRKKYDHYQFSFELTRKCNTAERQIALRILWRILDDDYWKEVYYNPVKDSYKIENDDQKNARTLIQNNMFK